MIFIQNRLYTALVVIALIFVMALHSEITFAVAVLLLIVVLLAVVVQVFALYGIKNAKVVCRRYCPERLSNGDDNAIALYLENRYPFTVRVEVIDEIPAVFQRRDMLLSALLESGKKQTIDYSLHPTRRGVYRFGNVNIFVSFERWGLIQRRIKVVEPFDTKVYPSFIHLRKFAIIAATNNLTQQGNKQIRRIGQQLEPDQIKTYVEGDDYRTINWKATARRHALMVNVFRDERAQNLLCVIDKGRTMQAAFEGMTLLDYSINAASALAYVAMLKGDKAGLLCFEKGLDCYLAPNRNTLQFNRIQELLYAQTSSFAESDYTAPWCQLCAKLPNRALLLVFTNFDSVMAMERQLEYLTMMARRHSVVCIFFEDSELETFAAKRPESKAEIYETVIAQKMIFDKQLIVNKLRRCNIIPLLSHPEKLSVEVINKYLEIKALM